MADEAPQPDKKWSELRAQVRQRRDGRAIENGMDSIMDAVHEEDKARLYASAKRLMRESFPRSQQDPLVLVETAVRRIAKNEREHLAVQTQEADRIGIDANLLPKTIEGTMMQIVEEQKRYGRVQRPHVMDAAQSPNRAPQR